MRIRTLLFGFSLLSLIPTHLSAQCTSPAPWSVPGTSILLGQTLFITFSIAPNSADLLTFIGEGGVVQTTGTPTVTSYLFIDGHQAGAFVQTDPENNYLALFEATGSPLMFGFTTMPTRIDFSRLNAGTVAMLVVTVANGTVTFPCAELLDNISRDATSFSALGDVKVLDSQLVGAATRTIQESDLSDSSSSQTLAGVQVTASPRGFSHLTLDCGFSGAGVAGGFVNGEIDNSLPSRPLPPPGGGPIGPTRDSQENITFLYPRPTVISGITLAFLFARGGDDVVNETARIQVNNGDIFDLTATGPTSFTWTGGGGVTNISPAVAPGCGAWTIANPFGSTPVTSLKFLTPGPSEESLGSGGSDFAIVSVSDREPVPIICDPTLASCRPSRPPSNGADLIPVLFSCAPGEVTVSVCNVGNADADQSLTTVEFTGPGGVGGQSRSTDPLPAQSCQDLTVAIPLVCGSTRCPFTVTVNNGSPPVAELNVTNNLLTGSCRVP